MKNLFDNLERLGVQARGESIAAPPCLAEAVLRRISGAEPAEPRWPIMAVTAGYAAAACVAMIWVFSAYGVITHPLLQFFNTVALAAF
jgi:hypothetical protein